MEYPRNSLSNQNVLSNKDDFTRLPPPHFTLRDIRNDTTAMKNLGVKTIYAGLFGLLLEQAVQLIAFLVPFGVPHSSGIQPSLSTVVWGPPNLLNFCEG
jgi:hypothetical protein